MQVFLRGGQMAVLDTMRTDIMHKAAVTIQRHARGLLVRRKVNRIRRAVIKIQVNPLKGNSAIPLLSLHAYAGIPAWVCRDHLHTRHPIFLELHTRISQQYRIVCNNIELLPRTLTMLLGAALL